MNYKTIRLEIRDFDSNAWRDLQEMHMDFENSDYCWYDAPQNTDAPSVQAEARDLAQNALCYGIYRRNDPEMIGYLIFHDFTDFYDVGYEFKKKYQGCGYALEALGCTISAVNRMRGICRFTARTAEYNLPSIRLLERAGFIRTGERRQQLRCDEDGNPVSFTALVYVLALPEPDGGCH